MQLKGIDVSKYQYDINWDKVNNNPDIQFAILRVGYRGYKYGNIEADSYFQKNAQKCKFPIGLYFYSQAITEAEAIEEANYCIEKAKGLNITWPIYFDTENATQDKSGRADKLSKSQRTVCARAFCDTIKQAGYIPGFYSYTAFTQSAVDMSQLDKYDIWIADYRKTIGYTGRYEMWQYTSSGTVEGINGRVDMNICYKDYRVKEEENMELVTLKIGPASSGDLKAITNLCNQLSIPVVQEDSYLIVGPASKGDIKTIEAKAAELLLPVQTYVEPEEEVLPVADEETKEMIKSLQAQVDTLNADVKKILKAIAAAGSAID